MAIKCGNINRHRTVVIECDDIRSRGMDDLNGVGVAVHGVKVHHHGGVISGCSDIGSKGVQKLDALGVARGDRISKKQDG